MSVTSAKGSSDDNYTYCKGPYNKDGKSKPLNPTFWEQGNRLHIEAERKGHRSDLETLRAAIDRGETYDEICETHFEAAAKYGKFIKERVNAKQQGRLLDGLKEQYSSAVLRDWQSELLRVVEGPVHSREIHWIWEAQGGMGKSWMASYLAAMKGAMVLTPGKKADLAYIFSQDPKEIVIFDLSRVTAPEDGVGKSPLDVLYSLGEDLKNGRIVNTKYESRTVFFKVPHVIFFANFEPDMTKWSSDRYVVKGL
jgi:hypothetical protein